MEEEDAEDVRELMRYEEGTAGALMTTEYIGLASGITAEQAIVRLRNWRRRRKPFITCTWWMAMNG